LVRRLFCFEARRLSCPGRIQTLGCLSKWQLLLAAKLDDLRREPHFCWQLFGLSWRFLAMAFSHCGALPSSRKSNRVPDSIPSRPREPGDRFDAGPFSRELPGLLCDSFVFRDMVVGNLDCSGLYRVSGTQELR
jgi:hypothetical protein